jgi:hypothetical protein
MRSLDQKPLNMGIAGDKPHQLEIIAIMVYVTLVQVQAPFL